MTSKRIADKQMPLAQILIKHLETRVRRQNIQKSEQRWCLLIADLICQHSISNVYPFWLPEQYCLVSVREPGSNNNTVKLVHQTKKNRRNLVVFNTWGELERDYFAAYLDGPLGKHSYTLRVPSNNEWDSFSNWIIDHIVWITDRIEGRP